MASQEDTPCADNRMFEPVMHRILINVALYAMLLLAACAEEPRLSSQEPPQDRVLTLSPGEKAALAADAASDDQAAIPRCVREKLQEAMPGLQMVPAGDFRSLVGFRFSTKPSAHDDIRAVLADPAVQAEARRRALRYLVIVGGRTDEQVTSPHAYYVSERHSYVRADVWDVPAAGYVGEFAANAWGTLEAIMVPLAYTPTEREACERVAKMLAKRLS
jgi:hypothetical protein